MSFSRTRSGRGRLTALSGALLVGVLLAGCGGASDDADDTANSAERGGTPETSESAGDRVGTDDFTFGLPQGWVETSDQVPEAELAFSATDRSGDIANNINVMRSRTTVSDVEQMQAAAVDELEASSSFTDVEGLDPYDVGGSQAAVVTSVATFEGKTYAARQYMVVRAGNRYGITFSFGLETTESEQRRIAESVLDSWEWAS